MRVIARVMTLRHSFYSQRGTLINQTKMVKWEVCWSY